MTNHCACASAQLSAMAMATPAPSRMRFLTTPSGFNYNVNGNCPSTYVLARPLDVARDVNRKFIGERDIPATVALIFEQHRGRIETDYPRSAPSLDLHSPFSGVSPPVSPVSNFVLGSRLIAARQTVARNRLRGA